MRPNAKSSMIRKASHAVLLALPLALSACGAEQEAAAPAPPEPIDNATLISELHARFEPDRPGYGAADYPGYGAVHIPKSYAKILLAEVERRRHGLRPDLSDLSAVAGRWLLDNADVNDDGVVGWGVPIAWDAYGDGSENPADTEYTISTAIVVDALLTWMEADPTAPGDEIITVVAQSLVPYTQPEMRSPSGMAPYSLLVWDRVYDTFNPAAYLAGQLQRFSRIAPDADFGRKLADTADATARALLDQKRVNPETGSWHWTYSIQENVANDLPHASYIVDGVLKYAAYGGRLAAEFDIEAIVAHLREFHDPELGYVRGWPRLQDNIDRMARTYDIGMAMTLACNNPQIADLGPVFASDIPKYRVGDEGFLKYPVGADFVDPLVVNEYEAYLYRGAVACKLWEDRNGARGGARSEPLAWDGAAEGTAGLRDGLVETPFASPSQPGPVRARLMTNGLDPAQFLLRQIGRPDVLFDRGEIPIATHPFGEGEAAIVRTMGENGLTIELRDRDGARTARMAVPRGEGGAHPIYRASLVHGGRLHLALYDNVAQTNAVFVFDADPDGLAPVGKAVVLPSFEDPAGGTYEMIPAVFLAPHDENVSIVAGVIEASLSREGVLSHRRIPDCVRAVEAIATPRGPAILCASRAKANGPFFVSAPAGLSAPALERDGVPFALALREDALSVEYARAPADFARMFAFDATRAQQTGLMEFGIGNEEGRIPWSQIYYLNGLIDLLLLIDADEAMREAFGGQAQQIRTRLDLEMVWLERHWREGLYATQAFTVDRSPALFAVQTSRLLLLMDRYVTEIARGARSPAHEDVRRAVHCLDGHIEVLARGGEPARWMSRGAAHLRWPKGSQFSFDGLAVPFNHQNEWAYAVLRTGSVEACPQARAAAVEILDHFATRIAPMGALPGNGVWDYWWGVAHDGWSEEDGVSTNRPSYPGDKIRAWISFRTIDAMALLAGADHLPYPTAENALVAVRSLTEKGLLYPFASYELARRGEAVRLERDVALTYARISAPWEMQSAVWAYRSLLEP
ncbi:MAG: hypothetical protein MEP57_04345 [Microvirga sp.]|nr:hypothetical protein [Microvirga sp.]